MARSRDNQTMVESGINFSDHEERGGMADLSFLRGSLKPVFANRVVGGRWESKVVSF